MMKRAFSSAFLWFVLLMSAGVMLGMEALARAQAPEGPDTTEATTHDETGTVVGVLGYYKITMKEHRGPFTYRLGLDLHIFGPDNRPLKITEVHLGDEATVYYYYRDNYPTAARIVVLRRAEPPTTK